MSLYRQYAQLNGIDPVLFERQIGVESSYNPKAVSKAGAMGYGQLMPNTAKMYGVTDPFDPHQNLNASARYMADLTKQYNGNYAAALAHYNGGTKAGKAVLAGYLPPQEETRNYLQKNGLNVNLKESNPMNDLTKQLAAQNADPYNNQALALMPQGEVNVSMLPKSIANAYADQRNKKAGMLPLALGAMLSGDRGISQVGSALYEDATNAMNPNKLSPYMTLMPDGSVVAVGDPTRTVMNQLKINQTNQEIAEQNDVRNQIAAGASEGIVAPWTTPAERKALLPTITKEINEKTGDLQTRISDLKTRADLMEEFGALNRKTRTGGLFDKTLNTLGLGQFAPDSNTQRMNQISSLLQTMGAPKGQGAVSNYERQLFSLGTLTTSANGDVNKKAREANEELLRVGKEKQALYQQFINRFGHTNGADQWVNNQIDQKYKINPNGATGAAPAPAPAAPAPAAANSEFDAIYNQYRNKTGGQPQ